MGLSTTLSIAQSALATNAALSSVVSRNIAGVNDPGYSRKIAALTPILNGTSTVSVSRATDTALYNNLLSIFQAWIGTSRIPGWVGLWPVHLAMGLLVAALFYQRLYGFRWFGSAKTAAAKV